MKNDRQSKGISPSPGDVPFDCPSARRRRGLENQNLFGNNGVPSVVAVGRRHNLITIGYEVATQIVIALGGVIVHKSAALDGDGTGIAITLVQHINLPL